MKRDFEMWEYVKSVKTGKMGWISDYRKRKTNQYSSEMWYHVCFTVNPEFERIPTGGNFKWVRSRELQQMTKEETKKLIKFSG